MTPFNQTAARVGPLLADHLWQSTLFAFLAGMIVLLLRKNPARFRFNVWLAASLKFLVPLSLLVHCGQLFAPRRIVATPRAFSSTVDLITQPFAHPAQSALLHSLQHAFFDVVPAILALIWALGFVAILTAWCMRWFQVLHAKKAAVETEQGLEVETLRTLERAAGLSSLPFLVSHSRLEPGIFGIAKPVLLWPSGISRELQEPQLQAILAHELWHVRRRDNLAAALQMLIEALFWFHPLVWWLGVRQLEERERACDEGVLELGTEPSVYAEGILKTCKFCVESPMPCIAGVNGSNLKKRIVRIMSHHETTALSLTRKFVLALSTTAAVAVPLSVGIANPANVQAESSTAASSTALRIVSLKRNHSDAQKMTRMQRTPEGNVLTNITAKELILNAYGIRDNQLTGGPDWIDQDRFDIVLTGGPVSSDPLKPAFSEAIKELLSERFHLVIRQETKPGPVYALVVSASGPKFTKTTPPNAPGTDEPLLALRILMKDGNGEITITGGTDGFAHTLSSPVGRPVIDQTGLSGIYAISFHWPTSGASADSISSALQEQLGLELVPKEAPVQTSVIESIDLPNES